MPRLVVNKAAEHQIPYQKQRGTSYLSTVMLLHRSFDLFSVCSFRLIIFRHLDKALASGAFVSSYEPKVRNPGL